VFERREEWARGKRKERRGWPDLAIRYLIADLILIKLTPTETKTVGRFVDLPHTKSE
jgi:hypothetical protein